jgi:hypothetical protein
MGWTRPTPLSADDGRERFGYLDAAAFIDEADALAALLPEVFDDLSAI